MEKKLKFTPSNDAEALQEVVFQLWLNSTTEDYGFLAKIQILNKKQLLQMADLVAKEIATREVA
jgi:hypothetical protein